MQLRGHFGGMVNVGAHGAAIVCGDEKSAGKSSAIRNGAVRYSEWRTFPVQMEIP
ncbi:MAG: hypothetical protein LBJ72_08325 [Dysgonamonadaceae bacterium]|nr:hypothetical protein [Dysgonamonadaceae bacterium]